MSPQAAMVDRGYSGLRYVELLGQLFELMPLCALRSDHSYIRGRKLGIRMGFAPLGAVPPRSLINRIKIVSAPRIPSKILESVVCSVAIAVARVVFWRARSDEGLENEDMYKNSPAWVSEHDAEVWAGRVSSVDYRFHIDAFKPSHAVASPGKRLAVKASHAPLVGNLIAGVSRYVFPDFHGHSRRFGSLNYTLKVTQ
jgi:hypothetical protein